MTDPGLPPAHTPFITLEGVEGCGKSTQARLLADCLTAHRHTVDQTREPGGTPLAEAIRNLVLSGGDDPMPPESELLLYLAARRDHVVRRIQPALAAGKWVICDRFSDATIAYQAFGRKLDRSWVERLTGEAAGIVPHLTLWLDLPIKTGLQRVAERGDANRFDQEKIPFHERVRAGYNHLAAHYPDRIVTVDARGCVAQVHQQIVNVINQHLSHYLNDPLSALAIE